MKSINEMNNRDLLGLLKVYKVLTYNLIQFNNSDNMGLDITIKQLFNEISYNTIRSVSLKKTTNYEDYGFKFIEYLFSIKNYDYNLFLIDLKDKIKFIDNLKKELNQLSKFQTYYKEFIECINKLNKVSDRNFFFETTEDGKGLFIELSQRNINQTQIILHENEEDYTIEYKGNTRLIAHQELYNNFLEKYESLYEELDFTMIF